MSRAQDGNASACLLFCVFFLRPCLHIHATQGMNDVPTRVTSKVRTVALVRESPSHQSSKFGSRVGGSRTRGFDGEDGDSSSFAANQGSHEKALEVLQDCSGPEIEGLKSAMSSSSAARRGSQPRHGWSNELQLQQCQKRQQESRSREGRVPRPGTTGNHVHPLSDPVGSQCPDSSNARRGASGVSHGSARAQTCIFEGPGASPKIPREDPQRETQRPNMVAGEGKKREILGSPHIGAPPFGAPLPSGAHPSGTHPSGPHHDTHQIQNWIGQTWIGQSRSLPCKHAPTQTPGRQCCSSTESGHLIWSQELHRTTCPKALRFFICSAIPRPPIDTSVGR